MYILSTIISDLLSFSLRSLKMTSTGADMTTLEEACSLHEIYIINDRYLSRSFTRNSDMVYSFQRRKSAESN